MLAFLASGCSGLQPLELEPEFTAAPAHSAIWDAVASASPDDWHILLNDGPTALGSSGPRPWRRSHPVTGG